MKNFFMVSYKVNFITNIDYRTQSSAITEQFRSLCQDRVPESYVKTGVSLEWACSNVTSYQHVREGHIKAPVV